MFNKTFITQAPAYPQHITVNEHRAPTDESVRLLREAEDRAQKAITQATRVENCPIDIILHSSNDFINDNDKYVCIFKLNGKKHRVVYDHKPQRSKSATEDTIARALGVRDAIAKEIATTLTESLLKHFGNIGSGF